MKTITLPKKEDLAELTKWFQKRDYSVLIGMNVREFIAELEERLELYRFAELSNGQCFTDPRWLRIHLRESVIITSPYLSNKNTPETSGISIVKKEYLPLLVENSGLTAKKQKLPSHSVSEQERAEYWAEADKYQQQMKDAKAKIDHNELSVNTPEEIMVKANEKSSNFKKLVDRKNQMIADADSVLISDKERLAFKDDFILSMGINEQKLVFLADVKNHSKQELLEQFRHLLDDAFQRLEIEEAEEGLKTGKLKSLNSFLSHYAIQYLDLLIYCLIEPQTLKDADYVVEVEGMAPHVTVEKKRLKLTDKNIAELLNKNDLDATDISDWKKMFYRKKLLNDDYMNRFLDAIKSEPANLKEKIEFKESKKLG